MACKTCKGTGKCQACLNQPKGTIQVQPGMPPKCSACGGSGRCPDCKPGR
jgi:hypothetical protein